MNPLWILRTARLVLTPVGGADLSDLCAFKSDPRVFAIMLVGVRSAVQSAEELAEDVVTWGANGFGTGSNLYAQGATADAVRAAAARSAAGFASLNAR